MKIHALRLKKGNDLKQEIVNYCQNHQIHSGCILTVVGCVSEVCIRKADGITLHKEKKEYEIVSVTGTIAENGVHFHIALSDNELNTIGGHMKEGCIVNTTAEIVLLEIDSYDFVREEDLSTGYLELNVKPKC